MRCALIRMVLRLPRTAEATALHMGYVTARE